jgi:ubiquinone/menaquinone biosynthesis C-methylase UbiE
VPVIPSALERFVFFGLKLGPAPALDIAGATGLRATAAAIRAGIFDSLASRPMDPRELAHKSGAESDRMTALLEHLVSFGYLERQGDLYRNSDLTSRWLVSTSPRCIAPFLRFWDEVVITLGWADLGGFMTGGPGFDLYGWLDAHPDHWQLAQDGFRSVARLEADSVARKIDLRPGAGIVDIGGGHGLYTVALLRRYPDARATILDLERPLAAASQTLAEAPDVADRIELRAGDVFETDLDGGFDAALLFNVIHGFQPERLHELLGRTRRTVRLGGRVFVLDQLAGKAPGPATRAFKSMLDLSYRLVLGGRTYSADELFDLLRRAGFERPRRIRLATSDLVEARAA